jgi:hypothetical protein
MTAQSNDTIAFEGREYEVTARSGGELFDPELYGFSPTAPHTGCWRGHRCSYAVENGRLVLDTLWICHGAPKWGLVQELWPLPELNGVAANEKYEAEIYQEFQGRYHQLHLNLPYEGSLLIAADDPSDEPRFRGYPRPWHFNAVRKLTFSLGRLVENRDVSSILKVFDSRYCIEGDFYGDQRRNGRRYLARHIGKGFNV